MKTLAGNTLDFVGTRISFPSISRHISCNTPGIRKYSEKITYFISSDNINTFQSFVLYIVALCITLGYTL